MDVFGRGARVWGYRRAADGGIESYCFDGDVLPDGWADSPARVDGAADAAHAAVADHSAASDPGAALESLVASLDQPTTEPVQATETVEAAQAPEMTAEPVEPVKKKAGRPRKTEA